jgi:hypothetical protein
MDIGVRDDFGKSDINMLDKLVEFRALKIIFCQLTVDIFFDLFKSKASYVLYCQHEDFQTF